MRRRLAALLVRASISPRITPSVLRRNWQLRSRLVFFGRSRDSPHPQPLLVALGQPVGNEHFRQKDPLLAVCGRGENFGFLLCLSRHSPSYDSVCYRESAPSRKAFAKYPVVLPLGACHGQEPGIDFEVVPSSTVQRCLDVVSDRGR